MTNQTNTPDELFELCKAVYEATRWRLPISERPVEYWVQHDDEWDLEYGVVGMPIDGGIVPLYTSDDLLENLPGFVHLYKESSMKEYKAEINIGELRHRLWGDTPLIALLKLTLKLHEENLL